MELNSWIGTSSDVMTEGCANWKQSGSGRLVDFRLYQLRGTIPESSVSCKRSLDFGACLESGSPGGLLITDCLVGIPESFDTA